MPEKEETILLDALAVDEEARGAEVTSKGVAAKVEPLLESDAKTSALLFSGGKVRRRKAIEAAAHGSAAVPSSAEIPLVRSIWGNKSGYKSVTFNGSGKAQKSERARCIGEGKE